LRLSVFALILLVLSGCAHHPEPPPEEVVVEEPRPYRYVIRYENLGTLVIPGFAAVEREGEFVLVPVY